MYYSKVEEVDDFNENIISFNIYYKKDLTTKDIKDFIKASEEEINSRNNYFFNDFFIEGLELVNMLGE